VGVADGKPWPGALEFSNGIPAPLNMLSGVGRTPPERVYISLIYGQICRSWTLSSRIGGRVEMKAWHKGNCSWLENRTTLTGRLVIL